MRIPGILLALLFGLASLGAAPASDSSQAAPGSAPPRIVLQLPRFPKLQAELQPVLPVLAAPDPDGAMPPRLALQLPRFPKLPELQPVLPVFADPDSDGAMPPRLALQLPRFPKLQPELQPVLPVLAAPDSHAR